MSVTIKIKQIKKMFREIRKVRIRDYENFLNNKYRFGNPDNSFIVRKYDDDVVRMDMFWVYPKDESVLAGRGFGVTADDHFKYELLLPTPATQNDVEDFIKFACELAKYVRATEIEIDGQLVNVKDLETKRDVVDQIQKLNKEQLRSQTSNYKRSGVFTGSFHPIWLSRDDYNKIKNADDNNLMNIFAETLNKFQKRDIDKYNYMEPLFYQNRESQKIQGVYAFEEGKVSIIPKEPYVPVNISLRANTKIDEWMVAFNIRERRAKKGLVVPYYEFEKVISSGIFEDFDNMHFIGKGFNKDQLREYFGHIDSVKESLDSLETLEDLGINIDGVNK